VKSPIDPPCPAPPPRRASRGTASAPGVSVIGSGATRCSRCACSASFIMPKPMPPPTSVPSAKRAVVQVTPHRKDAAAQRRIAARAVRHGRPRAASRSISESVHEHYARAPIAPDQIEPLVDFQVIRAQGNIAATSSISRGLLVDVRGEAQRPVFLQQCLADLQHRLAGRQREARNHRVAQARMAADASDRSGDGLAIRLVRRVCSNRAQQPIRQHQPADHTRSPRRGRSKERRRRIRKMRSEDECGRRAVRRQILHEFRRSCAHRRDRPGAPLPAASVGQASRAANSQVRR
jgi:hypothetical protein